MKTTTTRSITTVSDIMARRARRKRRVTMARQGARAAEDLRIIEGLKGDDLESTWAINSRIGSADRARYAAEERFVLNR
jgi:hypothetical protein